jgi:hypothetical protein
MEGQVMESGKRMPRVRVYFSEREWAALQDVAAANNMSESKCFKLAGMQTINQVITEVMQRMAAQKEAQTDEAAESTESEGVTEEVPLDEVPSEEPQDETSS